MFRRKMVLMVSIAAVLLIALAGTAVGVGWAAGSGVATPLTDSTTIGRQTVEEVRVAVVGDPLPSASGSLARPAPEDEQQAILQTIQSLMARWSGTVLKGDGWIHVVTHHARDKDNTSSPFNRA